MARTKQHAKRQAAQTKKDIKSERAKKTALKTKEVVSVAKDGEQTQGRPYRKKPGTEALRRIKQFQGGVRRSKNGRKDDAYRLLIPKKRFRGICRTQASNYGAGEFRFTANALVSSQELVEGYIIKLCDASQGVACYTKSVKLRGSDVLFTHHLINTPLQAQCVNTVPVEFKRVSK